MGSGRGWLAGDWPSTRGVLNITAAAWTAGFHWLRSGNKTRTQNVSEYMLVLAICLVVSCMQLLRCRRLINSIILEADKDQQLVKPTSSAVIVV